MIAFHFVRAPRRLFKMRMSTANIILLMGAAAIIGGLVAALVLLQPEEMKYRVLFIRLAVAGLALLVFAYFVNRSIVKPDPPTNRKKEERRQ